MKPTYLLGTFGLLLTMACASSGEKVTTASERARMLVEIANGALMEGDPTTALKYLERAQREDASLPELYHSRSLAFYAKKRMDDALVNARKAVKLHPAYAQANNTLGRLYVERKQYRRAERYLRKAAQDPVYSESYKARTNLGIAYYRQGLYSKSRREFEQAVADEQKLSCVARYYLGHLSVRQRQHGEAIAHYRKATRDFCGGFSDAHYALGVTLERNKNFAEARKKYIEVRELFPGSAMANKAAARLKKLP